MKKVRIEDVRTLRDQTGAGVMECRQALLENSFDLTKAAAWLKKKGLLNAAKKADRAVKAGLVEAYTHQEGQVVAVVEVGCETDFVSRTDEFHALAHELALQVAAMSPASVDELLSQPYIRDAQITVGQVVKDAIAKFGENIVVRRIARFELGGD